MLTLGHIHQPFWALLLVLLSLAAIGFYTSIAGLVK